MIFDLSPQGAGPKKSAVAGPIHVNNSHTTFGCAMVKKEIA